MPVVADATDVSPIDDVATAPSDSKNGVEDDTEDDNELLPLDDVVNDDDDVLIANRWNDVCFIFFSFTFFCFVILWFFF